MKHEAFSVVYETYKVMIFRICYVYLQNIEDSEDAVVETFIKFLKAQKVLKTEKDQRRYLTRIAVNVSKDMLRKKKTVAIADLVVPVEEKKNYKNDIIWQQVNKLENKYRDIILLRYLKDLPYKEIAKVLKISESLARKRHERAIKKLKEVLVNEEIR